MQKSCDFCGEHFKDGETISFIGDTAFKTIPSRVSYALSQNMDVRELYHRECLTYIFGTSK